MTENKSSPSLLSLIETFIDAKKDTCSENTISQYNNMRKFIKKHQDKNRSIIYPENIDTQYYDDLYNFGVNILSLSNNTLKGYFRVLNTCFIWGERRQIVENVHKNPSPIKEIEKLKVALYKDELDLLYSYQFEKQIHNEIGNILFFVYVQLIPN